MNITPEKIIEAQLKGRYRRIMEDLRMARMEPIRDPEELKEFERMRLECLKELRKIGE